MSTAYLWEEPRKLDIGEVAGGTFAVIGHQARILIPLTLALVFAPGLLGVLIHPQILAVNQTSHRAALWLGGGLTLVRMVFATFGSLVLIGVALADLET